MPRPPSGQVIERDSERGTTYAIRFRAYGRRHYVTLGTHDEGWTTHRAETELANTLADVRRGIWQPPAPAPTVEAAREEPTFHEYSSDWVERRRHGVDARTVDFWRWALSLHLLPWFKDMPPSEITTADVDHYRTSKVRDREEKRVERPLSNTSINSTLRVLGQVLEDAIEDGWMERNPARGRKRRLKPSKPKRTWLELDEVAAILENAGTQRALLATMILAGLRVGELCELRWRAVDLARGTLTVEDAKTDAGSGRVIDLTPMLREELTLHRASNPDAGRDELVFPTKLGGQRNRTNVRVRVLQPAIARANKKREKAKVAPIQEGVTNHTCRRTFASLLYEGGASPAYVMSQMGHASSALALEVYARKMDRQRDTGARIDALIRAAEWAPMGTNGTDAADAVLPAFSSAAGETAK